MAKRGPADGGWQTLLKPEWLAPLAVLLGGVLLHSMNALLLTTILPTIVDELGGAALMHWPTTFFLASSIVAATCAGALSAAIGARTTYCVGAATFGAGALMCFLAPSMAWIVPGRLVQGFGGGLLTALAYVLVRGTFPEALWPRAIALLSGMWSVSILLGPLVGGVFARAGNWRSAFLAVAATAGLLAAGAFRALPGAPDERRKVPTQIPAGRVALVSLAITATSLAAVVAGAAAKAGLIAAGIAILIAMIGIDRRAHTRLLPRDAFALASTTGVALWLVLLLPASYSALPIYLPIFLQRLHGLDPLAAGYAVAGTSMGWTIAALLVPGLQGKWPERLIMLGPLVMAAGLAAVAWLMAWLFAVVPALITVGIGIGMAWAFVAQHTMSGAREGDETVAASSVATVQQMGFALGGALAGLVANAAGLGEDIAVAAFWLPMCFVAVALAGFAAALRLRAVPQQGEPR